MMRKLLIAIPLFLLLLVGGVVVALKSMDFNAYRDQISAEVRKATLTITLSKSSNRVLP